MAYKYPDFVKATKYGSGEGLCGWNCYHSFSPFLPGFSTPVYTEEELKKLNELENTPVKYNGKEYTRYEATQKQRSLERTLHARNQAVRLLREGGADESDIQIAEALYRKTSHEYAQFSKAMGLPQQRQRVQLKNLADNNVKALTSVANGGIIKSEMKRRDANIGVFSKLMIPMQKKAVLTICKKYNIDTKGLIFKIQRSEEFLKLPFYGSTDYNNIGRIDLFPNAFTDEEQLVRTIIHEKCHVKQLRKYGKEYTQENLNKMEKQAYRLENIYYHILSKRVLK